MSRNVKTVLLIILVFVFGLVVYLAATSGGGSLFQGAFQRAILTGDVNFDSGGGITREAEPTDESGGREAEIIDGQSFDLAADTEDDGRETEIIDGQSFDLAADTEEEVREAEAIDGQSFDFEADTEGSTSELREAEDTDYTQIGEGAPITATTEDSYSTTLDSSPDTSVRAVAPECPQQSYMLYNSQGTDSFSSLLADIQNNTACSYRFILNSPSWGETIECQAGNTSVFNNMITCNKFAHQGDLHILVRVQESQAISSYRLENGTAVRTHRTPDFAVWKVGTVN